MYIHTYISTYLDYRFMSYVDLIMYGILGGNWQGEYLIFKYRMETSNKSTRYNGRYRKRIPAVALLYRFIVEIN